MSDMIEKKEIPYNPVSLYSGFELKPIVNEEQVNIIKSLIKSMTLERIYRIIEGDSDEDGLAEK